jgi:sulfate adenylyltransferase
LTAEAEAGQFASGQPAAEPDAGPGGAGAAAVGAPVSALTLDPRQLGDLELILSGAFAPLRGFMTQADVLAVESAGILADGTPWPVPVTLDVPAQDVPGDASSIMLSDPEGTPLAVLAITERTALAGAAGLIRLAGQVTENRPVEHGSFRRLMISPSQARAELGESPVLAFATRAPLGRRQIGQLKHLADHLKARLLLLPLVAGPALVVREPESLIRAVLAAARSLPAGTLVVPVPLAARDVSADREVAARAIVAAAYGASHLVTDEMAGQLAGVASGTAAGNPITGLAGAPIPVLSSGDWAYDQRAEVWRPHALIEPGTELDDLSPDQLGDLLDAGAPVPAWFAPDPVTEELGRARPPRSRRGFVVFLTGLSGSGKSTIARDLRDLLAEYGNRRVSLLDGDLVRSLLSAGLGFSRADRDLNIARIGYVATEVARHGGIAICAPIAPYAQAREQVRQMVSQVGDFLLVHVATPVEVCEARDRKGLYAKARAGLIDHFTGVNDPYEEPTDAMLVIDTSVTGREEATAAIITMLKSGGWLPATD